MVKKQVEMLAFPTVFKIIFIMDLISIFKI